MRREAVTVFLLSAVVCLMVSSSAVADPLKKAFSGCKEGTRLAKVAITVEPENGGCRVTDVTPASVCVIRGGVIRWKVYGDCTVSGSSGDPALEVTAPRAKEEFFESAEHRPTIIEDCLIDSVSPTGKNVFFCDIVEGAHDGFYKYGLTGQITGVDPGIEVRGPRAP